MFVFFPFWFALGLQNPGAGLCAADPVEHQPPVTASTVLPHQPCLSHSLLQPCKASSWAALQLLWVCQSPGRQLQVVGWTFGVLPKPGVTLVELHQCVLSRWGSDVLPWQKATPDVLPAVHIWFSLHSGGWGGSDGYSWAGEESPAALRPCLGFALLPSWVPSGPGVTHTAPSRPGLL